MARAAVVLLLALLCGSCASLRNTPAPPNASAQWYLATMYQQLALSRKQMPVLQMAGQAAARRAIAGGYLWAGGSQGDFGAEAVGRAGGLMGTRALDLKKVFRNDVVLYAARGALSTGDLHDIAICKNAGAYVVAFAAASGSVRTPEGPDVLIDSGEVAGLPAGRGICPIDTVTNLVNLWVWTGEFTAACTRMGKMPVLYKSYGLEGGRERDDRYAGQMFHTDMTIAPIPAGALGNAYLDRLNKILIKVEHDDLREISQAGRWIAAAGQDACGAQIVAHIYPEHFNDPRAFQPIRTLAGQNEATPNKPVLIHLSYQHPPQDLIDSMRRSRKRLFYCSVLRGQGGLSEYSIFANPYWPIEDGCVQVPGYDIPILPASAIVQAEIYWSIVAEASRGR